MLKEQAGCRDRNCGECVQQGGEPAEELTLRLQINGSHLPSCCCLGRKHSHFMLAPVVFLLVTSANTYSCTAAWQPHANLVDLVTNRDRDNSLPIKIIRKIQCDVKSTTGQLDLGVTLYVIMY